MPLFGKKKAQERDDGYEKLRRHLVDLEAAHAALERKFRELEVEWISTHDKLKTLAGRIDKRAARAAQEPAEASEPEVDTSPYRHLDPVSRRIMERRNAGRR